MRRRTRHWSVKAAMLLGIVLGLWLLGQMRPGQADAPTRPVARTTPNALPLPSPRMVRPVAPRPPPVEEPEVEEVAEPEGFEDTAEPLAEVVLYLEDADGYAVDEGWPYVSDCEVLSYGKIATGTFSLGVPPGEICVAWGVRRDGLLTATSPEVEFEGTDGLEVVLEFPVERTGGIGVRFQPVPDGMRVMDVLPGTPAWKAGLSPGDTIVSVDGLDASELDAETFVDTMTGPEGTDVEFEVAFEGDTGISIGSVEVTRAFLSG